MREKNKKIILAIAIFAVLFSAIFSGIYFLRKSAEKTEGKNVRAEAEEENGWKEIVAEEKEEEKKAEEENEEEEDAKENEAVRRSPVEIAGISDEALEILGTSREEIADEILAWAQENGFSSAGSASFQNSMEIRFDESKYTMYFALDFREEGNGSQPEESLPFVMDFYKSEQRFFFHE